MCLCVFVSGLERIELLAAAVMHIAAFPANEVDQWRAVFTDLQDFIVVELCDEKICDLVVLILKKFLFDRSLSADAMQIMTPTAQGKVPPLFGILKFVFQEGGAEACGRAVYGFLVELIRQPQSPFLQHICTWPAQPNTRNKTNLSSTLCFLVVCVVCVCVCV
jgi:hypothetical protein